MDGQELENNGAPADAGSAEANVPASESLNPDAAEVRTEIPASEAPAPAAATESPVTPIPVADSAAPAMAAVLSASASAAARFAAEMEKANALAGVQDETPPTPEAPVVANEPVDEPEPVPAPRLPRYRVIGNISHQGAQQLEDALNEFSKQGYELENVVRCTDGVIAILHFNRWL